MQHENLLMKVLLDPWLEYVMVIVQNAMYFFGDVILNGMLEHPLAELLNYYQFPFTLRQSQFLRGQSYEDSFVLDLRHAPSIDPQISDEQIDMFFSGQMIYNGKPCPNELRDDHLHFYNSKQSQIVIGASLATCWMN